MQKSDWIFHKHECKYILHVGRPLDTCYRLVLRIVEALVVKTDVGIGANGGKAARERVIQMLSRKIYW